MASSRDPGLRRDRHRAPGPVTPAGLSTDHQWRTTGSRAGAVGTPPSASAKEETKALYQWARNKAGQSEAGIFDAQVLFLEDPELIGLASNAVLSERAHAEQAWQTATQAIAARLSALEDPYLRARAADVADVAARVMRAGRPDDGLPGTHPALYPGRARSGAV